jgi:phospholipase D-like protein
MSAFSRRMGIRWLRRFGDGLALAGALSVAPHAQAAEHLCDAAFQNRRTELIDLIRNERVRIDASFWFMDDSRYSTELIKRWQAGIPVRVMMDSDANATYPNNVPVLNALKTAGIPMRQKTTEGILHRQFMLFAGQDTLVFSGANYSPSSFVPVQPHLLRVDRHADAARAAAGGRGDRRSVLSPDTYLRTSPGVRDNDTHILPVSDGGATASTWLNPALVDGFRGQRRMEDETPARVHTIRDAAADDREARRESRGPSWPRR